MPAQGGVSYAPGALDRPRAARLVVATVLGALGTTLLAAPGVL